MMMKACTVVILAILGSASAFAPASQSRSASALSATTAELESMVGITNEAGNKIFDPLNLAQWAPAEHLRKAELSNGRSAMLATVGWVWPKLVGTFDSNDVTTTDPIDAFFQADPQWWAQFIIFCGTIEAIKYRAEAEGKSYTGDGPAAIDWAKQWDGMNAEQKEQMRIKELKNGRLAMLGIAGFVSNHFIPGSCPVPDWLS